MPAAEGIIYSLYADPAYPQSAYVFGGFQITIPGSRKAMWNAQMSSVCQSVEWGLAYINKQWVYLNFQLALTIFEALASCKAFYHLNITCNLRTCYYGNHTISYFECCNSSMSIDKYLALID